MTHTPGPWAWDSRNGRHYLTTCSPAAPYGIVLGWPSGMEDGTWFTSDAYGRADACLIAAAPVLLAALKSLRNEVVGAIGIGVSDAIGHTNAAVLGLRCQEAFEAIQKAEGDK